MRRFAAFVSVGLFTCLLAPTALGQSSSNPMRAGRIEGTAVVAPALAAKKPRFRIYADVGTVSVPAPRRAEGNEVQNVVIYLESVPTLTVGTSPDRAPTRLAIEQRSEMFAPHVLAVLKGSTVEFPNADFVFHNVFSLSKARAFDLGRYPKGASKSVRFDRPGIVQVFCHIHADMSAIVVVADNPFFARPDTTGRYAIEGIPPGEYRVVAWHERVKPTARTVRVRPGETTSLNFSLPLPPEP